MNGYYRTSEPVGTCSCHACTCEGCPQCERWQDRSDPQPCPECAVGKHFNCDGEGWDYGLDEPCRCPCERAGHDSD